MCRWETLYQFYFINGCFPRRRFYLHFDKKNRLWLSAEDGCEGTPAQV